MGIPLFASAGGFCWGDVCSEAVCWIICVERGGWQPAITSTAMYVKSVFDMIFIVCSISEMTVAVTKPARDGIH